MTRRIVATLWMTLALTAAGAEAPRTPPAIPPAEEPLHPAVETERLRFRISPWVNLHHFLYQWARAETERDERDTRPPVVLSERREWSSIDAGARGGWEAAVAHYRDERIGDSLTFDRAMVDIRTALGRAPNWDTAHLAPVPPSLAAALRNAAPLYRERWWRSHVAADRAWVETVVPLLGRFGDELQEGMERAYGGTWPRERVDVEVTAYANWAGAYTTNDPMIITVASLDPDIQGHSALELLFHEASHTDPMEGSLRADLEAAFARRGGEPPRRFWHTVIFHTTGTLTRRALAAAGVEGYQRYAERTGLAGRSHWRRNWEALERSWLPFLEGKRDRAAALDDLATDLLGGSSR